MKSGKLGLLGWIVLLFFIVVGGGALALDSGVMTQAQADVIMSGLENAFVVMAATVFKHLAFPVILVAAFLLITHGRDVAGRLAAAAIIFAIAAGLVQFGAWHEVQTNGSHIAQGAGDAWAQFSRKFGQ